MTRSLVREHLFKLLFRIEFNLPEDMPEQIRLFFEDGCPDEDLTSTGSDIPDKDRQYIRDKYDRIIELLPEIDEKIDGAAKGWSISRIGKVELAVLRLAVYEIKFLDSIPDSVSVNEAVELAKKYTIDESGFVNGILGAFIRSREGAAQ